MTSKQEELNLKNRPKFKRYGLKDMWYISEENPEEWFEDFKKQEKEKNENYTREGLTEKATEVLGYSPTSVGYIDGFIDGYLRRGEEILGETQKKKGGVQK